ncbi:MAG TPA: glycosyltransferase family 4 protein [Thermoanaerobaculia bacterium]|jgi:glycosyltransferase involved in cell wall biosynthesis
MRILFVSHYALPHLGGIEVVVDQLAREMVRRGHEVTHVAAASLRPGERHTSEQPPYRLLRLPAWNPLERFLGVPYPIFRSLRAIVRACVASADVVHAHGMLYAGSRRALAEAQRLGRARVLTEHVGHVDYRNRLLDAAERVAIRTAGSRSARAAQAIVTLSDRVEAQMRRLAPSARLLQIANGLDTETYRPPRGDERQRLRNELGWDATPRVLFVGRLVEKKGLQAALAAARAGNGELELVIAGPGRAPAAPHVTHLGALPRQRVAELYRAADAFLLLSHGEGFPLTVQEALASGLPLVLARDPLYGEIAAACGPAVQMTDPDGTVDAIRAALRVDDAARARAAQFARARFNWSRTAERHLALYQELLG